MREVRLDGGAKFILSDTVGFISDLPTSLVAAFRATLEEVISADLVLHVRDISHPETAAQKLDVEAVLRDLGVDPDAPETAILEVWNKIDRLETDRADALRNEARRAARPPVIVSAVTREGLPDLLAVVGQRLSGLAREVEIVVPATAGGLVHWIYENTSVLVRDSDDTGATRLTVRVASDRVGRLTSKLRASGIAMPE
jgi:GTP-binding protein HflX